MAKTRGIRLKDHEEKLVQDFLAQNPFFDFSTMARIAITKFINDPQLTVKPVNSKKSSKSKKSRESLI